MRCNEQKCHLVPYYASCALQSCQEWAQSGALDGVCTSVLKTKRSFKRTQKGIIEEDAKSPVHFLKHCVLKVTTCPRHTKNMNTNTNALLSVVKSSCEVREIYIYEIVYKHISYYIIHYIENCIHW